MKNPSIKRDSQSDIIVVILAKDNVKRQLFPDRAPSKYRSINVKKPTLAQELEPARNQWLPPGARLWSSLFTAV
jgi:hypothetical protein